MNYVSSQYNLEKSSNKNLETIHYNFVIQAKCYKNTRLKNLLNLLKLIIFDK